MQTDTPALLVDSKTAAKLLGIGTRTLWRIANAPHNAVRLGELIEELGRDGNAALKSMVEWHLILVRTQSVLARDLPAEVYYRGAAVDAVVTMPGPGARDALLRMLKRGRLEPSALGAGGLPNIL